VPGNDIIGCHLVGVCWKVSGRELSTWHVIVLSILELPLCGWCGAEGESMTVLAAVNFLGALYEADLLL
jgi:hypothetical protein